MGFYALLELVMKTRLLAILLAGAAIPLAFCSRTITFVRWVPSQPLSSIIGLAL